MRVKPSAKEASKGTDSTALARVLSVLWCAVEEPGLFSHGESTDACPLEPL
jgi:hypothetical protein